MERSARIATFVTGMGKDNEVVTKRRAAVTTRWLEVTTHLTVSIGRHLCRRGRGGPQRYNEQTSAVLRVVCGKKGFIREFRERSSGGATDSLNCRMTRMTRMTQMRQAVNNSSALLVSFASFVSFGSSAVRGPGGSNQPAAILEIREEPKKDRSVSP
jgi:hypothetical protein